MATGNPGSPALRQLAADAAAQLGCFLRVLRGIFLEQRIPGAAAFRALGPGVPGSVDLGWNLESRIRPAELFPRELDLFHTQCRAMRLLRAFLVRAAEADHGLAADQCRTLDLAARGVDRQLDFVRIVAVDVAHHLPAIGLETPGRIVAEPAADVAVDRDAVVVVEHDQLAETERSGQRAGFMADALHQAAVAGEDVGVVIQQREAVTVEGRGQQALGDGEADRHAEPLTQRTGGALDAVRVLVLRVAGRLAVQLAEVLDLVQRHVGIAAQVQDRVQQHRTMPVGENEAIAVEPVRIAGIVAEIIVPQHFGDIGHAHRHARMTGIGLLYGVHRQRADGVGVFESGGHQRARWQAFWKREGCSKPIVRERQPGRQDRYRVVADMRVK